MIKTSVIILTKNAGDDLDPVLSRVYSQTGAGTFEVIIIDSGSTDRTLEIAGKYPVRLEKIAPQEFHHAKTRNYAAGIASGEILVFLTQDACPVSDLWLQAMLSSFDDQSVAAAYGRQTPRPGSTVERQIVLETVYGEERLIKDPTKPNGLGYRQYHFSDVNSAIRRNVWNAIRFPEDLKVFEDLGIAKRILDSGLKIVYEPRAAVIHSHNHTTIALFKRYFDAGVIWKKLGIWNNETRDSMLADMRRLMIRKLSRRRHKNGSSTHSLLRENVAKAAGLFLGLHARYLPHQVKRKISAFQLFE
jgi:rhamnosyltransferase